MKKEFITSESVTEGHPDKLCDKVADCILDEYLKREKSVHVACEVVATNDLVLIMGETNAKSDINLEKIARETICEIGYNSDESGFNGSTVKVLVKMNKQSSDINMGVGEDNGAGDQGMMFGYATNETEEYMPASIYYAHLLTKRLTEIRKEGLCCFFKPDGKSQVTIEYFDGKVNRIDNITISIQHSPTISIKELREFVLKEVIKKFIPNQLIDKKTSIFINPTGRFCIGGPSGDTGLTGRKIIVDTYGGVAHHGGGAFSGKDPSKVDRSAAYMMRYIAKNIVASGIIDKIEVGISYAIGMSQPTSIMINTFGKNFKIDIVEDRIIEMIQDLFPLTPRGIINYLNLREPIYSATTNYGHFGKKYLTWEKLDKVKDIKKYLGLE